MSGFRNWLRSKFTRAPGPGAGTSTATATSSWLDDPAFACALTLPYGAMSEEDVDRTFQLLTKWANKKQKKLKKKKKKKAKMVQKFYEPPKRQTLTVRIATSPEPIKVCPNSLQFTSGLSRELAHWLTASFPALRTFSMVAFKDSLDDKILAQLADSIGSVLLAPTNAAWCRQLTQLNLYLNHQEVAFAALARVEVLTALTHLTFLYHQHNGLLCPTPMAPISGPDGVKWISAEGPRQALMLPCLARLEYFEFGTRKDEFSVILYSLCTFLAATGKQRQLWLHLFMRKGEFDGALADLTAIPALCAQIHEIGAELPPWDAQNSLNDLVDALPALHTLHIKTQELSLLVMMRALLHLPHLSILDLSLGSHAQLPEYEDGDDDDGSLELPQLGAIIKLTLTFQSLAHGTIKEDLLTRRLFPGAVNIVVAWHECITCGLSSPCLQDKNGGICAVCWGKIVLGDGIKRYNY